MRKYYIILLCLCCYGSIAQSLKGRIKTASGEGIAGAAISVLNSNKGTISDKSGDYLLSLVSGKYTVSISAVGFATQVKEVEVKNGTRLDISLKESSQELDEVVVTADKTEQNILKSSVAVTSLSGKKVEEARILELRNLTGIIPNFLYQELGVAFQQIQSIRGIQVFSENPAVATYVDDVNALDILANGFQLADIERIEVLRGPQGTLFGRNAMGGVVNIVTKKPTNKVSGFAEAAVGNLGFQRYNFGFKTPLKKDKLFLGINGVFNKRNGFEKNDTTGLGKTATNIQGARVGDEQSIYGNVYLKWLPSSDFSAILNVKAQEDRSDATGFMLSVSDEKKAFANPNTIYLTRIGTHRRNMINSSLSLKYYQPTFTLTSISALQSIAVGYKDVDFPGYYHSFRSGTIGELLPPQKVFSQEVRINSNNLESKLTYSLGAYYFNQTGYEPTTNTAYEAAPDTYFALRNESINHGVAFFGQMGITLAPSLNLTLGLRYDNESRKSIFNGFGDAIFSNGQLTFLKPDTTATGTYNALSPKAALNYSITNQASVFLSYNRGFRAGGINAQRLPVGVSQTFKPEFSDNYEIGFKANSSNNKARIGLNIFLINWKDLQFYNLVAPFTYARENLGDVQTKGIELDANFIPAKNLEVDASIGINSGEYKNFTLSRVNFVTFQEVKYDVSKNKLTNAPSHTIYVAAQYGIPLNKTSKLSLRGEIRSIGSYYTDLQNTLQQPSYTLINTRINLQISKVNLSFWVQNFGDSRYLMYGSGDTSFGRSVRMAPPRTLGVTLNVGF